MKDEKFQRLGAKIVVLINKEITIINDCPSGWRKKMEGEKGEEENREEIELKINIIFFFIKKAKYFYFYLVF